MLYLYVLGVCLVVVVLPMVCYSLPALLEDRVRARVGEVERTGGGGGARVRSRCRPRRWRRDHLVRSPSPPLPIFPLPLLRFPSPLSPLPPNFDVLPPMRYSLSPFDKTSMPPRARNPGTHRYTGADPLALNLAGLRLK